MMKLIAFLLLLLPSLCFADVNGQAGPTVNGQAGPSVNGVTMASGTWLYAGDGEPYGTDSSEGTPWVIGSPITTAGAGTATRISVYIKSLGTATEGWVYLFSNGGGTRLANPSPVVLSTGWNDVTISYSVDAATTYEVWAEFNGSATVEKDASCTSFYKNVGSYTVFVSNVSSRSSGAGACKAFRMKVE